MISNMVVPSCASRLESLITIVTLSIALYDHVGTDRASQHWQDSGADEHELQSFWNVHCGRVCGLKRHAADNVPHIAAAA